MEVLPVPLAERVTVAGPRQLDRGVARAGGGIHGAGDHEAVSGRLTRDDGVGDREVHHRVGVKIEDEPARRPQAESHRGQRQSQVGGIEVAESVERAHRRVEDAFDRQFRERHPAQRHVRAEALAGERQHRVGCVDADDAVAPCRQLLREEARAAAEIEHGADAVRVGTPELIEERGPTVVAGVDDDLVVDPCQPRVRLDLPHRPAACRGQIPRILALAAANSSSVSTPWACSCARFWSFAFVSSSAGAGGGGAACCPYCCASCSSYLAA